MEKTKRLFAHNIKFLRTHHGMTQKELGSQIGRSEATVNKWEHGLNIPSGYLIMALASLFNVHFDDIMTKNLEVDYEAVVAKNLTENSQDPMLTQLEMLFSGLNTDGKARLLEYGEDLAASGRYLK